MVPSNPCERPGRTFRSHRIDNIWTEEDEARFMAVAPEHIRLAFLLALWTGQRQGDLLRLAFQVCRSIPARRDGCKPCSATIQG